jgi:hypothetical protein
VKSRNILKRSQQTTWKDFIAAHMAILAGTDFFTVEVGPPSGRFGLE